MWLDLDLSDPGAPSGVGGLLRHPWTREYQYAIQMGCNQPEVGLQGPLAPRRCHSEQSRKQA